MVKKEYEDQSLATEKRELGQSVYHLLKVQNLCISFMDRNVYQMNVKVPMRLIELIDLDLESEGDFRNRSEWVLAAIRAYIDARTEIIEKRKRAYSNSGSDDFISTPESSVSDKNDLKEC